MPIDRISGYPQVPGCLCLSQTLTHTGHDALTECLSLRDNRVGNRSPRRSTLNIKWWQNMLIGMRARVRYGLNYWAEPAKQPLLLSLGAWRQ